MASAPKDIRSTDLSDPEIGRPRVFNPLTTPRSASNSPPPSRTSVDPYRDLMFKDNFRYGLTGKSRRRKGRKTKKRRLTRRRK